MTATARQRVFQAVAVAVGRVVQPLRFAGMLVASVLQLLRRATTPGDVVIEDDSGFAAFPIKPPGKVKGSL